MPWELAAGAVLIVHFALAAAWDLYARRIPNVVTASLAGAGLLAAWFEVSPSGLGFGLSAMSLMVAFVMFFALRRLALAIDGRATLGGGDIKLLAATAAWTGIACIVLATVAASAILLAIALTRGMTWHDRLPFAPAFTFAVAVLLALNHTTNF